MKKYILISILFNLFFVFKISAQDAIWSDYTAKSSAISPALTGVMQGNDRVTVAYRNQYSNILGADAYQTMYAAYDRRWCSDQIPFGTGIRFTRDQAGSTNFTRNEIYISGAYYQYLGRRGGYLAAGVESGFLQNGVDLSGFTFDSQFEGVDYNPLAENGETWLSENTYLWDMGIGLSWINPQPNKYIIIGAALHHINTPNYSFADNPLDVPTDAEIPMRITFHGTANFRKRSDSRLGIQPRVLVQKQRKQWQAVVGFDVDYVFGDRMRVNKYYPVGIGAAWRTGGRFDSLKPHSDAVVLSTRIGLGKLTTLILNYDLNISKLRKASYGTGGFELTFTHQFAEKIEGKCVYCKPVQWFQNKNF